MKGRDCDSGLKSKAQLYVAYKKPILNIQKSIVYLYTSREQLVV